MSIQLKKIEWLHSSDPELTIWDYYVEGFTNPYSVSKILNEPVNSQRIIKIVAATRQAKDLYLSYIHVAPISKPILLLYSFERLASVLIEAKNPNAPVRRNHGIGYSEGKIQIKRNGLFRHFHSCYYTDNSICDNETVFALENLVSNNLPIRENEINSIFLRETQDFLLNKVHTSRGLITLHELDREFLFIFGLASLSRYNILRWNELLEGKQSDLITIIQRYLKSMVVFFPLIIASYLYDRKIVPNSYLEHR